MSNSKVLDLIEEAINNHPGEDIRGPEQPAIAHIGVPGWATDPGGPTALCGARLLGVRAEAGWDYKHICEECIELRAG